MRAGVPYLPVDAGTLLFVSGGCYGLFFLVSKGVRRFRGTTEQEVVVSFSGREVSFRALVDTGNLLRDPLTNSPVLVLGAECADTLLCEEEARALRTHPDDPAALLGELSRTRGGKAFWLIPYRSAGAGGMMPRSGRTACAWAGSTVKT